MNREIKELLIKNNFIVKKITIKNKVIIVESNNNKLVIKKRNNNLENLFEYLKSRNFVYFPQIIYRSNNYDIYEYINNVETPIEQKGTDIIRLTANLHKRTTFYKDVDEDYYKEIYENILNRINYLENYYNDIAEIIEKEEFMSPSQYLFIRNISEIFLSLNYAKYSISEWYKIIDEKKRVRIVNLHNNLELEHLLINDKQPFLISWDKSKKDICIYDLLVFYQKYYFKLDFCDLLKNYELIYPFTADEKRLFFCLISIPNKLEFNESEYIKCTQIRTFYDYLNNNRKLVNDYLIEPSPKKEQ